MRGTIRHALPHGLALALCGAVRAAEFFSPTPDAQTTPYRNDETTAPVYLQRSTDFLFDYDAGYIASSPSMGLEQDSGNTRNLAFNLLPRYQLRPLPNAPNVPSFIFPVPAAPPVSARPVKKGFNEELLVSGQKSFGVSYSPAGDLEFSQTLSLALKGKLSDQVGFSANLSDRNLPAGSGDFSQRLEAFDKIGFGFDFPQGNLNLGDFFFKGEAGNFLNFERKISGVGGSFHIPGESLTVALGSGPGEFGTVLFSGEDGKQGPYYFVSRGSFVVPGREKVYLDGELLTSGRDADYEVDYDRGALVFSPRRTISSFSRIRIEYEYQSGAYPKNILAARSATRLANDKLRLKFGYLSAKDNVDSPGLGGLTSEEKARLAAAGSDSTLAVRDGAVFVGPGKGDYTIFPDSAGGRQFRYVGSGTGDYTVRFSLARGGVGDYRYIGGGIYEYVGKDRGAYLPILYLPMPASDAGLGLGLALGPDNFFGYAEAALSQTNGNLLSRQEGVKHLGGAYVGGLHWQSSNTPSVMIEARLKRREADFRYLGRKEEAENAYRWNLPPGEENQSQTEGGVLMNTAWGWGKGRFNLSGLLLAGGKQSGLGESELAISPFEWLAISSRSEAGRSDYQTGHYRTENSVTLRKGALSSVSSMQRSRQLPYSGRSLEIREDWRERLAYKAYFLETAFGRREGYRNVDVPTVSGWEKLANFQEIRLGAAPVSLGRGGRAEGSLGWRQTEEKEQNFGRAYLFFKSSLPGGGWRLDFSHELAPVQTPLEVYSYADVGRGNGNYRLDNGEYVSDPYGNYALFSEPAGDTLAVYRVRQNWEAAWEPYGRAAPAGGLLSRLEFRANLTFDGDFVQPRERSALLPFLGLSETRRHELVFRQAVSFLPESRRSRWEIVGQEKSIRRSYVSPTAAVSNLYQGTDRTENSLGLTASFYGGKLTQNYSAEYRQKNSDPGFWTPFQIRSLGMKNEFLYSLSRPMTVSLGGRYQRDVERITKTPSTLIGVFPKLMVSFPGRGRVEAGFATIQVFGRPVSFEQAEGNLRGLNLDYSLNFEYRLGPKLSASAFFTGTQRPLLGKSRRAGTNLSYLF